MIWKPWKLVNKPKFDIPTDDDLEISKDGIELIKHFEGFKANAYLCPAGVWTIGYGTIRYANGKKVREGDKCTKAQATGYLKDDITRFEKSVNKLVTVPLQQHQFDALVCWTYNLGVTNLKNSTMLKVLNKGLYDQVPDQMRRWNRAGGKVLKGLTRRREAEAVLFETGKVNVK